MHLNTDGIFAAEKNNNFSPPKGHNKVEENVPSIDFLPNVEIESRTRGEQIHLCLDALSMHDR